MIKIVSAMALWVFLMAVQSANAAELVAGVLGPVRVVSAELTSKMSFPNLGLTTYEIVAYIESSNPCMVPATVVQETASSDQGAYTLTGVYAQGGCSGEMDPVITKVIVGDHTVTTKDVPTVTVNGITAILQ